MYQNIYNYFFEYDLSKTPGFTYVLANFLVNVLRRDNQRGEGAKIYGHMRNC